MKKNLMLIIFGFINITHGTLHIVQAIQSLLFITYISEHEHEKESMIDSVLHNPIFGISMAFIGIITLVIGIKDFIHHKKCEILN